MNIVAIVQARMGSTRLPGKVMKEINKKPLIGHLLDRLSRSKLINNIVVATSDNILEKPLVKYVESRGYSVFLGSEENVLERFYKASKSLSADVIVRITGDCPLVDADIVDQLINFYFKKNVEYLSNTNPPTYPDGFDIEVFSFQSLEDAYKNASKHYDLEHVTPYIISNEKNKLNYKNSKDLSDLRLTVDEENDFELVKKIFSYFKDTNIFSLKDILRLQDKNGLIFKNSNIIRNEGSMMGKGQKLYKRAKKIIPGGNMLLSKRPEMFLPDFWPSYYSKSKGCNVWDLDNNKFIDMSIMGIGTNILGYGNDKVDAAVLETVNSGNMSTLNCPEEVHLAERLVEINPWADMVRFARSGGEANAIAVRIARAASSKDNVAICGYHGWHDWYLAANISTKDGLNDHLLSGLEPNGVPKNLKGTIFPFHYNDIDGLKKIVENNNIGTIKMEVVRNKEPENNFLDEVRELATRNNIVLIFDECTSGFRETFGGIHQKYEIEPDIAMYGKALGNGYGITAIVGKKEIMQSAQNSFISSTFWTERIGPSAALKTLEIMNELKSWEVISKTGIKIKENWTRLANDYNLDIEINGISALPSFNFKSKNNLAYKTLITQEMLKKGYLASNSIYVCIDHTDEILDKYFCQLDEIFKIIKKCEEGLDVNTLLDGEICHGGFSRLN